MKSSKISATTVGLLGLGLECHAALGAIAAVAVGELMEAAPVAVGGPAAGPVALLGGLAHAALGLAGEPVALELVPELLHADHQTLPSGVSGSPAPVA